jgi:hypothetical protein
VGRVSLLLSARGVDSDYAAVGLCVAQIDRNSLFECRRQAPDKSTANFCLHQ